MGHHKEAEFLAMTPEQEAAAIRISNEICAGTRPDAVQVLEWARELYEAEVNVPANDNEVKLTKNPIIDAVNLVVEKTHQASVDAGWWTDPETGEHLINQPNIVPQKLCLIHSEISEAMEGDRKGLMDDHLPHRSMIEVELADAVIRIGDLAGALDLDLGGAVANKMAYNRQRADHKPDARAASGGKAY